MKRKSRRKSPEVAAPVERMYVLPPLPARPAAAHKGLFGRVLVVGGDAAMFGAAVLAATAALRAGSGLVQISVPERVLPCALSITPELIGLPLDDKTDKPLRTAAEAADALVIGPGMGQSRASAKRLMKLIAIGKPTVIDADALNLLAAARRWPDMRHAVLTPHPGEMRRLVQRMGVKQVPTDDRGRLELATTAAREIGATLLLKGHRSVITDGRRVIVNATGNSTLSKAGSGDVLSGVIGSLLGQGSTVYEAASAGAWLHGKAGEIAGEQYGARSAVAREVIAMLHSAIAIYPNQQ